MRRHPAWVWALWTVGAAALLATPFALADPGLLLLVLDPELLALATLAGLALVRESASAVRAALSRRAR